MYRKGFRRADDDCDGEEIMALTTKQMAESVLKILDKCVEHYPEEEREEAKVVLLNALSGQMFSMGMREKEK